jgi:toxin ParE1/3/4
MPRFGSWMQSRRRLQELLRMPNLGAPREIANPALKRLRVWPVKEFDEFLIFYVAEVDTLRVIRVLHGKPDIDRILKRESAGDDALH